MTMPFHNSFCAKCVMTQSLPNVFLNEEGVCNLCLEDAVLPELTPEQQPSEADFLKKLAARKQKGPYDCLFLCSGGKDSVAALFLMVKKYKLKPLVLMLDNGFESPVAIDNVQKAVRALGVDLRLHKETIMHPLFRKILVENHPVSICHLCAIRNMQITYDIAAETGLNCIIGGWSLGQQLHPKTKPRLPIQGEYPEYVSLTETSIAFMQLYKDHSEYGDLPATKNELYAQVKNQIPDLIQISPYWYGVIGFDGLVDTIEKELQWSQVEGSYPKQSTNCRLNSLSVCHSLYHRGFSHYNIEYSRLIRFGALTRAEALRRLTSVDLLQQNEFVLQTLEIHNDELRWVTDPVTPHLKDTQTTGGPPM